MLLRSYKLHDITYNNCNCSLFSHRLTFYTLFYFAPVFNISGTGSNHWDECSNYGPTKDESSINAVWILITLISATAIIIHSHFIKYSFRLIFLLDLTLESCFSLWGSQNATNVRWEFCIQGKGNIVSWIIVTPAILTITENGNLISFVWQNNEKIGKKKWQLKPSFGKAVLLLGLFHLFVFLFYPVPEVIFISFNTWYLSIINILEMDDYHTSSFFDLFCRDSTLGQLDFPVSGSSFTELYWSMRSHFTE